jgi:RNA polymerase sigma factor (sigma-70 family)
MRAVVEMTDAALVVAAQGGDREAFGVLYARHADRLLRFLRSAVVRGTFGGDATAEDIAQDAWAELLSGRLGKYEDRGEDGPGFGCWLRAVAKYGALRHFRRHGSEWAAGEYVDEWAEQSAPSGAGVRDNRPQIVAMREALAQAVEHLAPRQFQVVRGRLDGLCAEDIAARLGLSVAQVHKAYENAAAVLRHRLVRDDDQAAPDDDQAADERPDNVVPMRRMAVPNGADRARLREAANTLPPATRRVAVLKLDGHTNPAIAARLGVSVSTVCGAWRRACCAFSQTGVMGSTPAAGPVDADEAVRRLSPAARRVAELKLSGMGWPEIAAATGTTLNTARATWQRARRSLAAVGVTPSAA